MTGIDIQHLIDYLVRNVYIVLPIMATWIGWYVRRWVAAHASIAQQRQLSILAFDVVSAAEQKYKGKPGPIRFADADQALKAAAPQLSDAQRNTLILTGVRALNAGAIALVPDAAAVLTPETASAAPGVNIDELMGQANDAATGTAHDVATLVAHDAVQVGLQDVVNQVLARFAAAFTTHTDTSPTTHPLPVALVPTTTQSVQPIQVTANLSTPDDGQVRLDGTLTPITENAPTRPVVSKAPRAKITPITTSALSDASTTDTAPTVSAPADVTATDPSAIPAHV